MYVRLFVDAIQIYSSSKIRNTNFCEFELLKDLFRFKTIRASIEKTQLIWEHLYYHISTNI